MKKILSLALAAVMALSLVACGGNNNETTAPETTVPAVETTAPVTETTAPEAETTAPEAETTAPVTADANGATTVLQNIWNNVEEKWAIVGGSDAENPVWDAPGNYDLASENLPYQLLVPADQVANLTEAGSMIHMMNANTFTCAAYKLAEGADQAAFVSAMETAIKNNPWMCGFPDQLIVAEVEGFVVIAFGVNSAIDPFVTALSAAYPAATTLVSVSLAG